MTKRFLEAGRIVNTHGVRGEVKIEPWCDSPAWFCRLEHVYLGEKPFRLLSARPHGRFVLASLEGVGDLDAAILLKNRVIYLDRDEVSLPEGTVFLQDLIGLSAVNDDTGEVFGSISDVLELPSGRVYEIKGGGEHLIPDRPEFVRKLDVEAGEVRFRLIEGL